MQCGKPGDVHQRAQGNYRINQCRGQAKEGHECIKCGRIKRTRQHIPHAKRTPAAVDKRNKRERRRIGGVNHAFEILRQHTPTLSHLERASKISILRQAQAYIRELSNVLAGRNCCL
ncbi:hypothetical protein EGW08_005655 [Elysia chlorotica]|uniref:BHLH domain-containing protein n=1 Tax=Elysia chlorotica TaxID=188477 RepID=A0A433TYA4_ELYCH|nr:hypothetical protein EGW08_005655 [Elysia chlorotica]